MNNFSPELGEKLFLKFVGVVKHFQTKSFTREVWNDFQRLLQHFSSNSFYNAEWQLVFGGEIAKHCDTGFFVQKVGDGWLGDAGTRLGFRVKLEEFGDNSILAMAVRVDKTMTRDEVLLKASTM